MAAIRQVPGVKDIRPVQKFNIPKYVPRKTIFFCLNLRVVRPVFKHVVTGPDDPAIPPDSESTHIMTVRRNLH